MSCIDTLAEATDIIEYMASSIAQLEKGGDIERAGAFLILSHVADNIKSVIDEIRFDCSRL